MAYDRLAQSISEMCTQNIGGGFLTIPLRSIIAY